MQTFRRRPHPTVLFAFGVCWVLAAFVVASLAGQLMLLVGAFWLLQQREQSWLAVWQQIRLTAPFLLLYGLFGAFFGTHTGQILWQVTAVPRLGHLVLTTASLHDAVVRTARLLDLIVALVVVSRWLQPDDIFSLMGRRFQRISMTLAMVLHFFPQFLVERNRIAELQALRASSQVKVQRRNLTRLVRGLRSSATLYQTLLQNALARSWRLSESMYVRGYGPHVRTRFSQSVWRRTDVAVSLLLLLSTAGVLVSRTVIWRLHSTEPLAWQAVCVTGLFLAGLCIGGRTSARR